MIRCQPLELSLANQIHAAISDMADRDFLISKNTNRQRCCHLLLLGLHSKVVNVQVGLIEDLRQDLIRSSTPLSGLKRVDGHVHSHAAGNLATTETPDSIRNRGNRAVDESFFFLFRFPESGAVLVVMPDRSR